jgi:hypothetical protein
MVNLRVAPSSVRYCTTMDDVAAFGWFESVDKAFCELGHGDTGEAWGKQRGINSSYYQ